MQTSQGRQLQIHLCVHTSTTTHNDSNKQVAGCKHQSNKRLDTCSVTRYPTPAALSTL